MALPATNNLEGGSNTTTITTGNAGGTGNTLLDSVTIGTGCTAIFDNTQTLAGHGTLAAKLTVGGTAALCNIGWTTTVVGTQTQVWFRFYLFYGAAAYNASNHRIMVFSASAGICGALVIVATTGLLRFTNTSGGTISTTTNAVPLSAWMRVEGFLTANASTGQTELKTFLSPDSATATETLTSAATQNTGAGVTAVQFGMSGTAVANVGPVWLDDLGLNATGYFGPSAAAQIPQYLRQRRQPARFPAVRPLPAYRSQTGLIAA